MRGANRGPKEGRGRAPKGGKRGKVDPNGCTLCLHIIFAYLYFIYSTQIEDEKAFFSIRQKKVFVVYVIYLY